MPLLALLLFVARVFAPDSAAPDGLYAQLLQDDPSLPRTSTVLELQPDRALQLGYQHATAAQAADHPTVAAESRFVRIWQRVDGQWQRQRQRQRTFRYDVPPPAR
ncbi:MAG: hypothetical protein GAK31_01855 [Stenotrophomonas maltophilia]|uniref:DUF4440 domain-containing protein n=1 Tax=Stenotrophomonas maltophilia TaxID=40324 RepID=A0A7V8JMR1_STEMA|nr:MAG: hypothetical protein GAK31_01855 [Stenotrophomonas maltophilia]